MMYDGICPFLADVDGLRHNSMEYLMISMQDNKDEDRCHGAQSVL